LPLQKAKDEVNGAEAGEEEKPKKTAPPKKASAAEKRVAEKKAPAKKRAPKKVFFLFIFILTSMPDTLCRIQRSLARTLLMRSMKSQLMKMKLRNLKPRSERYVWRGNHGHKATSDHPRVNVEQRTAPKTAAKPASKKSKPASGRAKKVNPTDEEED
jgi:ribosomal protein L31E